MDLFSPCSTTQHFESPYIHWIDYISKQVDLIAGWKNSLHYRCGDVKFESCMSFDFFYGYSRMKCGYPHFSMIKIELSQISDEVSRTRSMLARGIMPESSTKVKLRDKCNSRVPGDIQHDIIQEGCHIRNTSCSR